MTHDDFGGLQRDLSGLVDRRRALRWMGGLTLVGVLAACSDGNSTETDGASGATTTSAGATETDEQPNRPPTPRPIPATRPALWRPAPATRSPMKPPDRIRQTVRTGPNFLSEEGIIRSDITTSVGSLRRCRRGCPDLADPHRGRRRHGLPAARRRRLPLALHGRWSVLDLRGHRPELPPGRAGRRRGRTPDLRHRVPRVLSGAVAPLPFRGLRQRRGGVGRQRRHQDLPACAPPGRLRGRLRRRSLRQQPLDLGLSR